MTPRQWLQRCIGQMREVYAMSVDDLAVASGLDARRVTEVESCTGAPATDAEIGDLLRTLLS